MNKQRTLGKSETDWERVDAMRDDEIDYSDNPEWTPEMFARAERRVNGKPVSREEFARAVQRALRKARPRKQQLTLRIDPDVVAWFKSQGRGYQTRINTLLRVYMEERLKARA